MGSIGSLKDVAGIVSDIEYVTVLFEERVHHDGGAGGDARPLKFPKYYTPKHAPLDKKSQTAAAEPKMRLCIARAQKPRKVEGQGSEPRAADEFGQELKIGDRVKLLKNICMHGKIVAKSDMVGELVEDCEASDKAELEQEEDSISEADHFVSVVRLENNRWKLKPSSLCIRCNDVVHFSWSAYEDRRRKPDAENLERFRLTEALDSMSVSWGLMDRLVIPPPELEKQGAQYCNWTAPSEPGERYLQCSVDPDSTLSIQVVSQWEHRFRRALRWSIIVGLPIVLAIVLAVVAYSVVKNSSIVKAIFVCQDVDVYCEAMEKLEAFFLDTAFFPLFCAILILVLGIPIGTWMQLRPSPALKSFGQGYHAEYVRNWRKIGCCVVAFPICALLIDWRMNVLYTQGLNDLSGLLGSFVDSLLGEMMAALLAVEELLKVAASLEDLGLDLSTLDTSMLHNIVGFEGTVRAYAQLGLDLLSMLFFVRLTLDFVALLGVAVALSYGVAGLYRRSGECLNTSSWMSVVSLCLVMWLLAFNSFIHKLWMDTFQQYMSPGGVAQLPAPGVQGMAVSLLAGCSGDASTSQIPYADLIKPFNSTLAGLGQKLGQTVKLANAPGVVTQATLASYAKDVSEQVHTLSFWLSHNDITLGDLNLGTLSPLRLTPSELRVALDAGLPLVNLVVDVLQCRQIRPFLAGVLKTLEQEVMPPSNTLVVTEWCLAAFLVIWVVLALWLKYLYNRPLKKYRDHVSERWFRFKWSYTVSFRLRKRLSGSCPPSTPARVQEHWFNVTEFLQGVLLLDTVLVASLFIGSCMLLWFGGDYNPTREWVVAGGVLLIISSLLTMAGSWSYLGSPRNRCMRAIAALLVAFVAGAFGYSAADSLVRVRDCWHKVGYDPLAEGPTANLAHVKTAGEVAGEWTIKLTGPGLNKGDRIVAAKELESCPPTGAGAAFSRPAASYGRAYAFNTPLEPGVYGLCWCSVATACSSANDFGHFSGHLYIDTKPGKFETCSLVEMAGMSQSAAMLVTLGFPLLLRVVLGIATIFECVYSMHITDRMRRVIGSGAGLVTDKRVVLDHVCKPGFVEKVTKTKDGEKPNVAAVGVSTQPPTTVVFVTRESAAKAFKRADHEHSHQPSNTDLLQLLRKHCDSDPEVAEKRYEAAEKPPQSEEPRALDSRENWWASCGHRHLHTKEETIAVPQGAEVSRALFGKYSEMMQLSRYSSSRDELDKAIDDSIKDGWILDVTPEVRALVAEGRPIRPSELHLDDRRLDKVSTRRVLFVYVTRKIEFKVLDSLPETDKTATRSSSSSWRGSSKAVAPERPESKKSMILDMAELQRQADEHMDHQDFSPRRLSVTSLKASFRSREVMANLCGPMQVVMWALMLVLLVLILILLSMSEGDESVCYLEGGCGPSPSPAPPAEPTVRRSCETCCNLQEVTCSLSVDEAAFATSHNAMSSQDLHWLFPNNLHSLTKALDAGIRGLMIDVWYRNLTYETGEDAVPHIYLCHGPCGVGNTQLLEELVRIKAWLDEHPRELIVFILEQYVSSVNVMRAFQMSGLSDYCYGHPSASMEWPRIGDLIEDGKRVILFSNRPSRYVHGDYGSRYLINGSTDWKDEADAADWWHYEGDFFASTVYTYDDLEKMTADCWLDGYSKFPVTDYSLLTQPGGGQAHRLIVANHFMSVPLPCEGCAHDANALATLQKRMVTCRSKWGHQVNFPTVDFWSIGDIMDATFQLNGP